MERNSMVAILGTHWEGKSANGYFRSGRHYPTLLSCRKAGGSTAIVFEPPNKYSFFGICLEIFNQVSCKNSVLSIFASPIRPKVDPDPHFMDLELAPLSAFPKICRGSLSSAFIAQES